MNPDAIRTVAEHVRNAFDTRVTNERQFKLEGADLARPRVQDAVTGTLPWTEVFTGKARGILQNQLASNQWNARATKALLEQDPERLAALVVRAWAGELEAAATELDALLQDERIGSNGKAFRSVAARASVLSFFRFLADPRAHPMFRSGHVANALRQLGHPPLDAPDPATLLRRYDEALDEVRDAFVAAGLPLEDRLDAQAILWACNSLVDRPNGPTDEEDGEDVSVDPGPEDSRDGSSAALAAQVPAIQAWLRARGLRYANDVVACYLCALMTKPFVVLTGLSGTGKTRLAIEVNELLGDVYVVPVKPDWTDTRGVLGYLNPLTQRYETTETLKAVLAASGGARLVTLVLDEMNLAHVERYFADVLSAMESGAAIPLHESDEAEADQRIPRKVTWPKNLLVVGTVNADETTYPFSPKVLDRAFVLDVSRVEARAYLSGARPPSKAPRPGLPDFLPNRDWRTLSVDPQDRAFVLDLHDALREAGRPFGYRTIDEALAFLTHARSFARSGLRAQDALIATKVLPRFHGRAHDLEPAMGELAKLMHLDLDAEPGVLPPSEHPWSERLLRRMKLQLGSDGYVESMVG